MGKVGVGWANFYMIERGEGGEVFMHDNCSVANRFGSFLVYILFSGSKLSIV